MSSHGTTPRRPVLGPRGTRMVFWSADSQPKPPTTIGPDLERHAAEREQHLEWMGKRSTAK